MEHGRILLPGRWQNDPIENVTNVKLLAKSTKVYNWWAMAAEIRITSAAEATTDTEVVDKSGLTDALAEAKALNEADYTAMDIAAAFLYQELGCSSDKD